MPLENAAVGTPGFSRNVETEVAAGKPVKQAVAIAYSKSGEHKMDRLDEALAAADGLYARSDAMARGDYSGVAADAEKDPWGNPLTVKGPSGKMYKAGTTFHNIGGRTHAISPENSINIRKR